MKGNCRLCEKEDDLKESHFIPKFVGKWIRKTSATGYIRQKYEPHKRSQDIAKEYWLCGDCEQLFSKWEREFANKVFYPFVEQGVSAVITPATKGINNCFSDTPARCHSERSEESRTLYFVIRWILHSASLHSE
jgi:hypothetical protein